MLWVGLRITAELGVTSAIAQFGPIGPCVWYAWLYVADTTFAADASAAPTSPTLARMLLAVLPAASCSRIALNTFPEPGSVGVSSHFTFSCAAAWIASYSCFATTPTK